VFDEECYLAQTNGINSDGSSTSRLEGVERRGEGRCRPEDLTDLSPNTNIMFNPASMGCN